MNCTRAAARLAVLGAGFLFLLTANLRADDDVYPRGPVGGRNLAAQLVSLRPAQDTNWHGTLKISGRNHKTVVIPITCIWKTGDATWSVAYETGATDSVPAEKLTIIFSTNNAPEYFYSKAPSVGAALPEPTKLAGATADVPLAGSDFWLSDLGFDFYHWPGQNLLTRDTRRNAPCFVLDCTTPNPPTNGYGRVRVWIETDHLAPLEAEAYAADGKLLKDYELGSIEKINGQYQLKDLKISNEQTGSRTQLLFDLRTK